jgi:hypothetical protein
MAIEAMTRELYMENNRTVVTFRNVSPDCLSIQWEMVRDLIHANRTLNWNQEIVDKETKKTIMLRKSFRLNHLPLVNQFLIQRIFYLNTQAKLEKFACEVESRFLPGSGLEIRPHAFSKPLANIINNIIFGSNDPCAIAEFIPPIIDQTLALCLIDFEIVEYSRIRQMMRDVLPPEFGLEKLHTLFRESVKREIPIDGFKVLKRKFNKNKEILNVVSVAKDRVARCIVKKKKQYQNHKLHEILKLSFDFTESILHLGRKYKPIDPALEVLEKKYGWRKI